MSAQTRFTIMHGPLGRILLVGSLTGLHQINFLDGNQPLRLDPAWQQDEAFFSEPIAQLDAYFNGGRIDFDMHLALDGTPFQRRVWRAVQDIPYGSTRTYAELACQLGRPKAARAVGVANGSNPLPILIPCHRVIGSNGSLTGYAGGLKLKQWLLRHERQTLWHKFQHETQRAFQPDLI